MLTWAVDPPLNYWTVDMVADYMGVSRSRVKALMREGRFKILWMNQRTAVVEAQAVRHFQKLPGGRPRLTAEQKKDLDLWMVSGGHFGWMMKAHPSMVPGGCRVCGRKVGTVVPESGNGGVRVVVKHKPPEPAIKMRLPGGAVVLPQCRGTGLPPKGWPTGKVDLATGLDIQPEDPRYKTEVAEMGWRPGVKK